METEKNGHIPQTDNAVKAYFYGASDSVSDAVSEPKPTSDVIRKPQGEAAVPADFRAERAHFYPTDKSENQNRNLPEAAPPVPENKAPAAKDAPEKSREEKTDGQKSPFPLPKKNADAPVTEDFSAMRAEENKAESAEKPTESEKSKKTDLTMRGLLDGEKGEKREKNAPAEKAKTKETLAEALSKTPENSEALKNIEITEKTEEDAKSAKASDKRVEKKSEKKSEKKPEKRDKAAKRVEPGNNKPKGEILAAKEPTIEKAAEKPGAKPKELTSQDSAKSRNDALLSSLSSDDIRGETEKEKRRVYPVVRKLLMGALLLVLIGASVNLLYSMYSRRKADRFYRALREQFYADDMSADAPTVGTILKDNGSSPDTLLYSDSGDIYEAPDITTEDLHTLYTRMLPSLEALKKVNSSAFGWIKVEGTRVDYPVVRSPQGNNDYYLTHALDLTYSDSGSIFMDFSNNTNLSKNRNTCIYGHNMNDGTMFQTIMNFRTIGQFRNGSIYVYTADGIFVYTPFSVYDAVPTDSFFRVDFGSDEEFSNFLTDIRSKSIFRSTTVPKSTDKIVTLITCTNTIVDKRFVVHGVLSEIVK